MTAAMSDSTFYGTFLVVCLALWLLAVLFAVGLGRAAAKPPPDEWTYFFAGAELPITRPDLDAQLTAIAVAEGIVRAEYEAAS